MYFQSRVVHCDKGKKINNRLMDTINWNDKLLIAIKRKQLTD